MAPSRFCRLGAAMGRHSVPGPAIPVGKGRESAPEWSRRADPRMKGDLGNCHVNRSVIAIDLYQTHSS
jgi:hypothetical protein